jgi:cytochrome P450
MTAAFASTPASDSLVGTANALPYDYYERMREKGEVVWDEGMKAWIVTSLEASRHVLRNDKVQFNHALQELDRNLVGIIAGGPSIVMMTGDRHTKMHQWFIKAMSPPVVDKWRGTFIRPVATNLVDRFASRGRADLVEDVAETLPSRVIAAMLGLDWKDDAFIDECKDLMKQLNGFFNNILTKDKAILDAATAASEGLKRILLPTVKARVNSTADDLISLMWRGGRELFPDWTEEETYAQVRTMFFAGSDTTTHAISNAFYMLLTNPDWMRKVVAGVKAGDGKELVNYVEEALRLYGAIHFRVRIALEDSDVAGVHIRKGDTVIIVLSAANRDPAAFACPMQIDTERANRTHHMTFHFGPRACVGASLARANIQEALRETLSRCDDLRLDPAAPQPSFVGFGVRCWRPINVLFKPETAH